MNMYCDRFSVCGSMIYDRDTDMEMVARAKNWHVWKGMTEGGKYSEVTLCDKCVASHRRALSPAAAPLPNQYPIPQLEVVQMSGEAPTFVRGNEVIDRLAADLISTEEKD